MGEEEGRSTWRSNSGPKERTGQLGSSRLRDLSFPQQVLSETEPAAAVALPEMSPIAERGDGFVLSLFVK